MNAKQRKRRRRHIVTQAELEKEYQHRLKLERTREWKWRHTKQGAFDSSMVRYDALESTDKMHGGTTLGAVVADTDRGSQVVANKRKLDHACQALVREGRGYLVRVLRLIAKNVNNREQSICELMKDYSTKPRQATSTTALRSAKGGALRGAERGLKSTQGKKS